MRQTNVYTGETRASNHVRSQDGELAGMLERSKDDGMGFRVH